MTEPQPVGDPVRAFRRALSRAHKAENRVRDLQARLAELEAQRGQE